MRPVSIKIHISLLLAITIVSNIWAQSVYWSPSSGTLQKGKANSIDLFYDSCEPTEEPNLPTLDNLTLNFRRRSSSRSLINGQLSSKIILNYQAIPSELGQLTIPSIRVQTSEGEIQVPAARFEIVEASVGNTGLSPSEVFISLFQNRDEKIYQGEVFELEYIAGAKQQYQLVDLSVPTWNPKQLVTTGLEDSRVASANLEGSAYTVKVYLANAMATESGVMEIPGASQDATVVIGRRRDFMFQEPVYDSFKIESDPFALEILPLPTDAPNSFAGAVGEFQLDSRVVPEQVQVGEPVTWTLELSGTGNWPAGIGVPARSVSSRFKAIQPEIKNEFAENDLFTGIQTEDIVLIPTEAGSFQFGPLEYTYFDPKAERYKTITIPSTTVSVSPAEQKGPAGGNEAGNDPGTLASSEFDKASLDLSPTGQDSREKTPEILREPLAGETLFSVPGQPRNSRSLIMPTAIAVVSPLALWFLLAFSRSIATDPKKAERKALSELRKISRMPLPSDAPSIKKLHHKWRSAASRYLLPETEEPSPDQITAAAQELRGEEFAKYWRDAWLISDQTLFGQGKSDQAEWSRLQKLAVGASPAKYAALSRIFKYSSWFPCLALVLTFSLAIEQASAQGEEANQAAELYQNGNFAAAGAIWTAQINKSPEALEPRYNAGLAAAQQGDWPRAWAFWTSALCLDPHNDDLAWNIKIAHQNTTAYDPVLRSLVEREGLFSIISMQSPAGWQRLSYHSIWALGILLGLGVVAIYVRPVRRSAGPLIAAGILAGVLAHFSVWAHQKYEALGEPDTQLFVEDASLLSIPTDLQQDQVTSSAGAGTIAKVEKRFLTWVKVSLPNGETGWTRQQNLLPLYGPISGF